MVGEGTSIDRNGVSRLVARPSHALAGWARRHPTACSISVLVVVVCAWCWPVLLGRRLGQDHIFFDIAPWKGTVTNVVPAHAGEGDVASVFSPLLRVAKAQLEAGHLPFWNPYSYGGNALLGDMQTALLFPLTWLALALPFSVAWGVIAMVKLLVAGVGAFALSRELGVRRRGALLAGVVFMLSAPNIVWLQWPIGSVFALLPWLFLATDRLFHRPAAPAAFLLSVVVGLSILAGHPESAALGSLCAGVYLGGLILWTPLARRARVALRVLAWWLAAHVMGALLAAPALLPFLEALRVSISREEHAVQAASAPPLHSVLMFFMPTIYGTGEPRVYTWSPFAGYTLIAGYFGLVCIVLACVALWRRHDRPRVRAMAVTVLFAGGMLYHAPPLWTVARHVWPFNAIVTTRMYVYLALAAALAAGAAVADLTTRPLRRREGLVIGAAVLGGVTAIYLVEAASGTLTAPGNVQRDAVLRCTAIFIAGVGCLAALGRVRSSVAVPMVIAACILDLVFLQSYNVWLSPRRAELPTTRSLAFLQTRPPPFRVSSIESQALPPNTSARWGLESVEGYDFPQSARWAFFSHAVLGQRGVSFERLVSAPVPGGPALPVLRLLNVRYYVGAPDAPSPNPRFRSVYSGDDARIYEDPTAGSRAVVVTDTRPLPDRAALNEMAAGRVDLRREALVPASEVSRHSPASAGRDAAVQQEGPDRLRVRVPAGPPGWLVVGNAYAPQWRATVDGRSVRVRPTNYAMLGVPVAAGAHDVELWVAHDSFWVGIALSAATVLAMGALALVGVRRRHRRS